MSLFVLPRLDTSFLAEERWGATSLSAVGGVWAVVVALGAAICTLVALSYRHLPSLRESMDAGANASVLPAFSVASLVGFGAVIAALSTFAQVRDWVLSIEGGPLVSLAVATNVLAALTGSAWTNVCFQPFQSPQYARPMSVNGTSATFTQRGLMSGSGPFSDISAWPAYVAD